MHTGIALLLLTSDVPWIWRLPALLLLALAGWHARWRSTRTRAPICLRRLPSGWRVTVREPAERKVDGREAGPDAAVEQTTFADLVGPVRDWGILLCFCLQERVEDAPPGIRPRRWHLALWSDQLPADDWRRLRVSLIWRRREAPGQRAASGARMVSRASGSRSG